MSSTKLTVLKCFAQKETDCWVAVCLDFNLAAQGDSYQEVKAKLEAMIEEYVHDATIGEDGAHADYLLSRRAPLSTWMKYRFIQLKVAVLQVLHWHSREYVFNETMPLRPA